MQRTGRGERT